MLRDYLIKKLNGVFYKRDEPQSQSPLSDEIKISGYLNTNLEIVRKITKNCSDVIIREFLMGNIRAAVIYIDGLVNTLSVDQTVIKTLMYGTDDNCEPCCIDEIINKLIVSGEIKKVNTVNDGFEGFLSGDTFLMADGIKEGLIINTKGFEKRSVDDPQTDSVIRGSREGFIENIRTNTALLRRRIKSVSLCVENIKIGRETKTAVDIIYLENVANSELISEIKRRLIKIDIDGILDSGYLQYFLDDNPKSVFSLVDSTEKPDIAAAKILEGRAAVVVDGSPFVLTAPMYFGESFQSPEDYYIHSVAATMLRVIRYLSFFVSILALPAYVALTTFHQELIPTQLLYTMAAAESGTPFASFIEALMMTVVFEILKEAGVRLPKPVGQAVSIVGALVIGETAVSAGLIGAPMVIAVSITAVTAFVTPAQANTIVLLRYILLVLSAVLGGFGITVGLLGILIHLMSLKSFGTPYLAPLAPLRISDLKDTVFLAPVRARLTRPHGLSRKNPIRQKLSD